MPLYGGWHPKPKVYFIALCRYCSTSQTTHNVEEKNPGQVANKFCLHTVNHIVHIYIWVYVHSVGKVIINPVKFVFARLWTGTLSKKYLQLGHGNRRSQIYIMLVQQQVYLTPWILINNKILSGFYFSHYRNKNRNETSLSHFL